MDNAKTGHFIRACRLELGLTQKELADSLHITDRAVSKWERGLSAPDIALLEPLAKTLGVSVVDIMHGERSDKTEPEKRSNGSSSDVIEYAVNEIRLKVKRTTKRLVAVGLTLALIAALACIYGLWRNGYFNVVRKSTSPDGGVEITVYNRDWKSGIGFSQKEYRTFIVFEDNRGKSYLDYGNLECTFTEWSVDSSCCLLGFRDGSSHRYELFKPQSGTAMSLNDLIYDGICKTEKAVNSYDFDPAKSDDLYFSYSGWRQNTETMVFSYCFTDERGNYHNGVFYLDYGSCVCTPIDAEISITENKTE